MFNDHIRLMLIITFCNKTPCSLVATTPHHRDFYTYMVGGVLGS